MSRVRKLVSFGMAAIVSASVPVVVSAQTIPTALLPADFFADLMGVVETYLPAAVGVSLLIIVIAAIAKYARRVVHRVLGA